VNVTLKNIPEELHDRLRRAADESGRSLNKLILHDLKRLYFPQKADRSQLIQRIHSRRASMKTWINDDSLAAAIEEGRK